MFTDVLDVACPEPNSGCFLWEGGANSAGYPFYKGERAHRLVYKMYKGPIPKDHVVHHICENRLCVNPDHLEVLTVGENVRRSAANTVWGKLLVSQTCRNGHRRTPENTYYAPGTPGIRRCKVCIDINNLLQSLRRA